MSGARAAAAEPRTTRQAASACRVLIPLATPCLYGLERAVIEAFDCLRPDVTPLFVQSASVLRRRPPIINELERRHLRFSLLPDGDGWPRLERPRSAGHALRMIRAFLTGNWYYARAVHDADALYVTGSYAARFTLAAAVRCRLAGKPVVHHFHDLPTRRLPVAWSRLVTHYVHNTECGRQAAIEVDPRLSGRRHTVLPCIVEASNASRGAGSPIHGNGKQNFVFAGQVALYKGIDLLIEAFGRIFKKHPDVLLHIVGGCEESFLPTLQSMCERSGGGDRIKYWGYRVDAIAFLRDAYVCVQSTPPNRYTESFGRTVVEAMAFGVPAVCLRSGALAEIVVEGDTGLTCAENVESLAAALDRFAADAAFRNACGTRALGRYRERYSPEVVRPRWNDFFAQFAARSELESQSVATASTA